MPYKYKADKHEHDRIYRLTHKRDDIAASRYRLRTKIAALTHYGNGKCACVVCGYSNDLALSIDHINSNGAEHRAKNSMIGSHFYLWLKNNNYPEGYQTLCMNCQFIKRHTNKEVWKQSPKVTNDINPRLL